MPENRCLTCGLRIRTDLVGWKRTVEHGTLVGYICPRCQQAGTTTHSSLEGLQ
ncbi:hypothetical protein [Brevibacterium casei]|uniref:Uncharacterized protein n=1 Tax=Brevibacterium casei TaxID=33889 RepID=A0A449CYV2_9MICO|nr:hypothetical protein [Brevibacterium casei]MBE4695459.1 hypothetical protein [Brevibacterium casei]MBY3578581.1 hypothetical protein [Brevibacterium casei]VEW10362.1 Uncharacterised protein [Brevibacterium casei]